MLIALIGSLCSGKHLIAEHLQKEYGFQKLVLDNEATDMQNLSLDEKSPLRFLSASELLLFVTKRWTNKYVTLDLTHLHTLDEFRKRPFFLLVAVDAPISLRWNRYRSSRPTGVQNLDAFVQQSDDILYGKEALSAIIPTADLHISNHYHSANELYEYIGSINITSGDRLRPSWDTYFMSLADLAARRSNCMKRRVGCILVRDKRVLATGYNGTPRGLVNCNQGGCTRCNGAVASGNGLEVCLCMHAEENALIEAGRERVGDAQTTLYCNTCPCLRCATKIVQIGVREVVYSKSYSMDAESAKVLQQGGVLLRQHTAL